MFVPAVSKNFWIIDDEQANGTRADPNVLETIISPVSDKPSNVAPKKRKSLKSGSKVITTEENVKEVCESKEIAENKKPNTSGRKRKPASDVSNHQFTTVNLNLNAPPNEWC